MTRERFLFFVAAVCGGAALALELTASRLLAPVFGTSMIVWSAIIGSTLVYLTIGYGFGGWLADRKPEEQVLYKVMGGSAILTGIIPFLAHPLLQWGWRATSSISIGVIVGSFVVLLFLFAAPVALLGSVSPFVLRLIISDVNSAGRTSGKLSAIATLGSLVGALLPALFLVPVFGTRYTFLIVALIVMALTLFGFYRISQKRMIILFLVGSGILCLAFFLFRNAPIIVSPHAVFETDSIYNYIQVQARGKGESQLFSLRLNESQNDHSVYRPGRVFTYQVWDYSLVAPMLVPDFQPEHIKRMALIGGAAGTMAKVYTHVFGPIPIDHVEIDPDVTDVARRFFGLQEENIFIHNEDGRAFLARSHEKYDVIVIDAYQIPYIPFHLTTQEFFKTVYDHLSERGAVMVNTLRIRESPELFSAICKTMQSAFPSVYVLELFGSGHKQKGADMGNTLLFATASETTLNDLRSNAQNLKDAAWLNRFSRLDQAAILRTAIRAENQMRAFQGEGRILTDDHAPVEWLVHESILRLIWNTVTGATSKS